MKEFLIKILVLIILILLIIITDFRSGEKFFILKNSSFGSETSEIQTGLKRWELNVKIRFDGKEILLDNDQEN